ncbi:MAG: CaiB/BaiF CoA-transferase family protein [Rhodomicrobiaceae bacterium]
MRPLDGITVIAFEHAVAAPTCTRHLADQGARVIKIERPGVGDFARGYDDRVNGLASYFVWANRSKESLTLDVKRPEALGVLDALIGKADVVVQNFAPGAAARLGLSFDELSARNPRIVVCDISGYGEDGPYRDRKAYDLMIQAEAGLLAVTGVEEHMARCGFSAADVAAAMYAYSGVLSALLLRERTGKGSRVEVSLLDALAEWMGNPMYYTYGGRPPAKRTGAYHPSVAPYGPVRTVDGGIVMIGLQNEREWATFCEHVLGEASLRTDPRFVSNNARAENRQELDALIMDALAGLTAHQVMARLQGAGLACAKVNSPAALWDHPQLAARDRWRTIGSPAGELRALLPPATNSAYKARMQAVPALGEHTDAILAELGFGVAEIAALHDGGVV